MPGLSITAVRYLYIAIPYLEVGSVPENGIHEPLESLALSHCESETMAIPRTPFGPHGCTRPLDPREWTTGIATLWSTSKANRLTALMMRNTDSSTMKCRIWSRAGIDSWISWTYSNLVADVGWRFIFSAPPSGDGRVGQGG